MQRRAVSRVRTSAQLDADVRRRLTRFVGYSGQMDAGSLGVLAVGLAMDATAVSAARGLTVERIELRHLLLVAGFFGGFQGLMPLLGYGLGASVGHWVQAWDHWLVFVLLGGLGLRMLREAYRQPTESSTEGEPETRARPDHDAARDAPRGPDAFALPVMVALAIATSIDALAAGITLPLLGAPMLVSSVTIGAITALLSMAGLWLGRRFGAALGRRLDIAGGLALIALGTKTLIEHLWLE